MVRGVDLQRVLAQVNQVERLHYEQLNSSEQQQKLLSIQQNQQSLIQKITVQKSETSEKKKVDEDGKRGRQWQRGKGGEGEVPQEELDAEDLVLKQSVGIGGRIDVDA
ncbi:MAG: hypothetical protein HYY13_12745 [Nitrospirae bacterium]|nr:hypothetical protein [Nitrospirota bacterium]